MKLEEIQVTIGGYPVKNLVAKPHLGIITGLVKAPISLDIRDNGWIGCAWNYKGFITFNKKKKKMFKIKDEINLDI